MLLGTLLRIPPRRQASQNIKCMGKRFSFKMRSQTTRYKMNIYLEKIAAALHDTSNADVLRGLVSQGWNRHNIANQYGQKPDGEVSKHISGMVRHGVRASLEGLGGSVLGDTVGGALARTVGATGLVGAHGAGRVANTIGAAGALGGALHGLYASSKNQSNEMHREFAGKAALERAMQGR